LTLCIVLRLDGVIAWVAANISNPFFSPFLLTAEVQLGGYLHTGATLPLDDLQAVRETGVSGFLLYAFTGAPLVAAALAISGALLAYLFMLAKVRWAPLTERAPYTLPEAAPPWWHATERVASRYAPLGEVTTPAQRSQFHYVRIKTLTDPITKMIVELAEEGDEHDDAGGGALGEVLDIGTGRGQIPIMLLELGHATRAHGIDWDEVKIVAARAAAEQAPSLHAHFVHDDMRQTELPKADTVLLIDVVHYLDVEAQDALLARAAGAVRAGGMLVVREADSARGWRSTMTWLEEKLFTFLRFNVGARVVLRDARDIVARLHQAGLECQVRPAWGKTPFSNVLIVGRRAGTP
jgi:2-polyprenyl-3-methyl-5-hydroxy-6-metoxy-1,4-benzoquinol methylase